MGASGNVVQMFMIFAIFGAVMYFGTIRPQQKKDKKHKAMLDGIRRGDTIVTIGGFWGQVRDVLEDSFIIELAEGVRVRILKSAVSTVKDSSTLKGAQKGKKSGGTSSEKVSSKNEESQEEEASLNINE